MTSNPLMEEEQRTEGKDNDHDKEEEDKSEEAEWMMTLDDDLFGKSREKRRLSRNMKRANKKQYNRSGGSCDNHIQRIDSEGLKMLQKADPSLESVRNKALQIMQLIVEHDFTGGMVYCAILLCLTKYKSK